MDGAGEWKRVVFAADCDECECCDDLVCPICTDHYAECGCPGPTQDGIEYEIQNGILMGRETDA